MNARFPLTSRRLLVIALAPLVLAAARCAPGDTSVDQVDIVSFLGPREESGADLGSGWSRQLELVFSDADAEVLGLERSANRYEPAGADALYLELQTGLEADSFDQLNYICYASDVIVRDLVNGTEAVIAEAGRCEFETRIKLDAKALFSP